MDGFGTILVCAALLVLITLYEVYDPFLDIVEMGGRRYLVLWYNSDDNTRDYKIILELDRKY